MHAIYKSVLVLLLLLNNDVFAKEYQNYELNNSLQSNAIEIEAIIKKAIKQTNRHWGNRIKSIKFDIRQQSENVREMGFSNADASACKIDLLINNDDFKDEDYLFFSVVHEIAHCYVGKDVFLSPDFNWKIQSVENNIYQKYIDEKTVQLMSNTLPQNTYHPLIVYHEIAADVLALNWIADKELYLKIYEIRLEDWQRDLTKTKHASHWSIEKIIENNYLVKDSNLIIEYGFKSYIDEMMKIN